MTITSSIRAQLARDFKPNAAAITKSAAAKLERLIAADDHLRRVLILQHLIRKRRRQLTSRSACVARRQRGSRTRRTRVIRCAATASSNDSDGDGDGSEPDSSNPRAIAGGAE